VRCSIGELWRQILEEGAMRGDVTEWMASGGLADALGFHCRAWEGKDFAVQDFSGASVQRKYCSALGIAWDLGNRRWEVMVFECESLWLESCFSPPLKL